MDRSPTSATIDREVRNSEELKITRVPVRSRVLVATTLGLVTVASAILRFHALTAKSFWFDEGASVGIARLDWYNFVRILWRREANMALYYLLLRAWLHLGSSEWFIRALSVLLAIATIPAIYILGRRLFDSRVGLIAAALLAVNAFHVRYSQEARSYSLTVLLCVISSLYFLKWLETPTRVNRLVYIVVSSLAVYAQFFSGLVLLAHWISLCWLNQDCIPKRTKRTWIPLGIAVFPLLAFVAATGAGPLSWIQKPGLRNLWQFALLMTGARGPALVIAFVAACTMAASRVGSNWRQKRVSFSEWRYRFLLAWLLLPFLLVIAVSFLRPLFVARYLIVSLPGLVLLAAAGLARTSRAWLLVPGLAVFLVFGYVGIADFYHQRLTSPTDNWRTATQYVLSNSRSGDGLFFYVSMGRLSYEYYRSLQGVPGPQVLYPYHGARITFLDFVQKPDYVQLRRATAENTRVWFVVSHSSLMSGHDKTEASLAEVLNATGVLIDHRDFGGIQILLYGKPDSH